MPLRFSTIILIFIALFGGMIYTLHLLGLVTAANEVYARFIALGIFIAGFVFFGWQKAKNHRFSWDDIYKNNTLIIGSLTVLLAGMFVKQEVNHYLIGFFVGASLLHFIYTRKFYPPNKLFYFVWLYALLLVFGTIGTKRGFHFPDSTLSFFVLPLAFCFFRLQKETLLKIANIFFKTTILFLAICIVYWWYNFLHLDANFVEWVTEKTHYEAKMSGWTAQQRVVSSMWVDHRPEQIVHFFAYFFVNSWAGFFHPSFISYVLFFALISGFYLYHKKNNAANVRISELILFVVLCIFVMILMQSRIGIIGLLFILIATGIYFLKLKTNFFKIGLLALVLLGSLVFFATNSKILDFTHDEVRRAYNHIAVSYIQDNMWWGSGFRQQQIALEQHAEIIKDQLPSSVFPHFNHPIYYVHNQFLGDMVQFGIGGLIALLLMLFAVTRYAIKSRSYLLQMFLLITILFMMIEEPLYVQAGITRFMVFLVFFTAFGVSQRSEFRLTGQI